MGKTSEAGKSNLNWGRQALSAYTWCVPGKGPLNWWLHKIGKANMGQCRCGHHDRRRCSGRVSWISRAPATDWHMERGPRPAPARSVGNGPGRLWWTSRSRTVCPFKIPRPSRSTWGLHWRSTTWSAWSAYSLPCLPIIISLSGPMARL